MNIEDAPKQPGRSGSRPLSEGLGHLPHPLRTLPPSDIAAIRAYAAAQVAAERERWRDLADHLRHCRECGDTDVAHCHEGAALWKQATGDDLGA